MEAAARQLETLTQLEKRRQTGPQEGGMPHIETSNIRRAAGGADSGGGFIQHGASPSNQADSFTQPQMPESSTRLRRDPPHMSIDNSEVTSLPSAQVVHPAGYVLPRHATAETRSNSTNPASLSVPHYADVGLSTELTNMLARSSFDPGLSAMGSVVGGAYDPFLSAAGHLPVPSSQDQLDGRDYTERQVRTESRCTSIFDQYVYLTIALTRDVDLLVSIIGTVPCSPCWTASATNGAVIH
jgi:hypothetical protein